LFLLGGAGCNVLALRGEDGALLVDGGLAANAEPLLRAVYAATGTTRVNTLINTHWHPEAVGANELVGRAGGKIFAHEKTAMYLGNRVASVTFEGKRDPLPEVARPTETTRAEGSLSFAGHRIAYGYLPLPRIRTAICSCTLPT
jgi:glyoxylase-like metal-dependent hydrolase (beta-lactamase superfamily II)